MSYKRPTDKINAKFQLKVYLNENSPHYQAERASNQRTFYSRYADEQTEAGDSFSNLRELAHRFRLSGHMRLAEIYDNQDQAKTKMPLVKIYADGREKWFTNKASQVHSPHSGMDA